LRFSKASSNDESQKKITLHSSPSVQKESTFKKIHDEKEEESDYLAEEDQTPDQSQISSKLFERPSLSEVKSQPILSKSQNHASEAVVETIIEKVIEDDLNAADLNLQLGECTSPVQKSKLST
jgi:hypothetical protein